MILIAESGSTKCDWVVLNSDGSEYKRFSTMGFNPYFHSAAFIYEELSDNAAFKAVGSAIEFVYFYGAGASSESLKDIIKDGLKMVLPEAVVNVDHDLVASAYSTYTGEPAFNAKFLIQYLGHRRKTVGGTRGIAYHGVFCSQFIIVHPQDNSFNIPGSRGA